MRMQTAAKGLMAVAVFGVAYVNQNFTPLFWVLLALLALDVLLNVGHEGQQFAKIGSAVASLGGVSLVESHLGNPDLVKVCVAVLVLAYLQIVAPQLYKLVSNIRLGSSKRANAFLQAEVIANLQAEVARLNAQAAAQLRARNVASDTASAASATASTPATAPTDYHA